MREVFYCKVIHKPGSVSRTNPLVDHLSSLLIAQQIMRIIVRTTRSLGAPATKNGGVALPCSRQGLPSMPCHHDTMWALTPLFSPLPVRLTREAQYEAWSIKHRDIRFCRILTPYYFLLITYYYVSLVRRAGGIVSVALSLGLPLVAVSNCHAHGYCPDFPPRT